MRRFLAPALVLVLAAAAAALVPLLAGPAGAADARLDAVTVAGNPGEKPTVTSEWPFRVKSSVSEVRTAGSGTRVAAGDRLTVDFVVVNGRTGAELQTSYGASPAALVVGPTAFPAVRKALVGAPVGSRVVLAVAPEDGLTEGGASLGVKKNDTLLYVVDIRGGSNEVAPVEGLPTVKLAKSGAPKITVPKTEAPTSLVVQPLIEGSGAVVQAGQTIEVQYTGAIWDSGKVFDSSWTRGQPAQFAIGTGNVIAGWDSGLVGQTVGSQVLLVIPPEQGYGAEGQPAAGIEGTDTLVFVVDILAAS
jgi:peptidylprolyl isomerase